MGAEVELKLATSKSNLRKAMALPWLRKMAGETISKQDLTSVYFDTDDCALRAHGVSLRVRKTGKRRLQTIKAASDVPMARSEWEAEIDRDRPNLELADSTALAPLLTNKVRQQLKPVFETRIERVVMPLRFGDSEIELALDQGRIGTADCGLDIAEIEIELKQGERHDAARLARRLARSVPVTFSPRAKAELGYALLDGALDAPVFGAPVTIASGASAADAFVIIGFACLRHLAGNEAAVRSGDPEGIHQMRVGLRRLRAALSLFKNMLQGADANRIKRELKWLADQLGPARDQDVFLAQTVRPYLSRHPHQAEFEALAQDIEKQRHAGFATARAAVDDARFRRLLLDCVVWLLDGEWRSGGDPLLHALRQRPVRAFAQDEMERRTRKIAKRIGKLEKLDPRGRHKLRIAVKKLRYGRQFFASLEADRRGRKPRPKVDRALKGLQSALGDLNDIRVHAALARDLAATNAAARKAFAVGYLSGREEARAGELVSDALAAGKRLRKAA